MNDVTQRKPVRTNVMVAIVKDRPTPPTTGAATRMERHRKLLPTPKGAIAMMSKPRRAARPETTSVGTRIAKVISKWSIDQRALGSSVLDSINVIPVTATISRNTNTEFNTRFLSLYIRPDDTSNCLRTSNIQPKFQDTTYDIRLCAQT